MRHRWKRERERQRDRESDGCWQQAPSGEQRLERLRESIDSSGSSLQASSETVGRGVHRVDFHHFCPRPATMRV
jgi:hypothetical protein